MEKEGNERGIDRQIDGKEKKKKENMMMIMMMMMMKFGQKSSLNFFIFALINVLYVNF